MLSRVAERIYWMARYTERAEDLARLIGVNSDLQLDLPSDVRFGWKPLVAITGSEDLFLELYDHDDERSVVRFLVADERNPSSILSALSQARENVRTIRDIMPRAAWEQVNNLFLSTKNDLQAGLSRRRRHGFLRSIVLGSQQMTGLLAGTMSYGSAYEFIHLGRNLERADMTTRIIDVRSATLLPDISEHLSPFDNIQWMSVLKSLTAYQMYRQHVRVRVQRPDVLRFLFKDHQFPRSVYHCLAEVKGSLEDIPRSDTPLRTVTHLQRLVSEANPSQLSQSELHAYIDDLQLALGEVHQLITATYFVVSVPDHKVGS